MSSIKLKRFIDIYTGNSISDGDKDKYTIQNENTIPYISTKDIEVGSNKVKYYNDMYIDVSNNTKFKIADKNSILLCIEGGSAGKKIAQVNQKVCFVNKLCCFNPSVEYNQKFVYFYLQSELFLSQFNLNLTGLIGGVSQSIIKEFKIPFYSIDLQNKIANFLDKKVSMIDETIENNKKEIELLKEYLNSEIITKTSKGFNNNYIDSQIEWFDKINKEFSIMPLSSVFYNKKLKNKNMKNNNLLSLSYGNIVKKNIESNNGLLPESFETYQIVDNGDIILRLTDLQNDKKSLRTGLVKEKGIITSAYLCISPIDHQNIDMEYMHYLLHGYDIKKVFYNMGSGVRQGLNFEELKKMKIVVPDISEQIKIKKYLLSLSDNIEKIIKYRIQIIEKLEEYKKSLIYEAVTGKIEV